MKGNYHRVLGTTCRYFGFNSQNIRQRQRKLKKTHLSTSIISTLIRCLNQ